MKKVFMAILIGSFAIALGGCASSNSSGGSSYSSGGSGTINIPGYSTHANK